MRRQRSRRRVQRGLALLVALVGCSGQESPEEVVAEATLVDQQEPPPAPRLSAASLTPQLGGLVQVLGAYAAELAPRQDGRIEAQLRDAEGRPVTPEGAALTAEISDGPSPVQVTLVPSGDRYVGTIPSVTGSHPITLVLDPPGPAAPEVQVAFPPVALTATEATTEPWHQGQVTTVGDNRVEVSADEGGRLTVSVTDLAGRPVPPAEVELSQVELETPTGPQVVAVHPEGPVFVGTIEGPPPPQFTVALDVGVRGHHYPRVRVRHAHPLPPGAVVVVEPRPPAPLVVIDAPWPPPPPSVEVRFGGHPGKGWAKGHWGHPGRGWAKGHGGGHPGRGWGGGHGGGRGHGRGRH